MKHEKSMEMWWVISTSAHVTFSTIVTTIGPSCNLSQTIGAGNTKSAFVTISC